MNSLSLNLEKLATDHALGMQRDMFSFGTIQDVSANTRSSIICCVVTVRSTRSGHADDFSRKMTAGEDV